MKLKETVAAGLIGLSTLAGCGEDPEVQCGNGIKDYPIPGITDSTANQIKTVWDYCAATAQVGMLDNKDAYVMCTATCVDSPKGCERKYTCRQVWEQTDIDGNHLDVQSLNNCTGNTAVVCTEKVDN